MAVSFLVTFLYGSMVWGILPVDQTISWESHLFGSIAGIFCAIYYRNLGPQRQKAQWEIDEEAEKLNEGLNPEFKEGADIDLSTYQDPGIVIHYDFIDKKTDETNTNKSNDESK